MTAFLAWSSEKRKTSGHIETTAADQLWAESRSMRQELREEVEKLRAEVWSLRAEVKACHTSNAELRARLVKAGIIE